MATERVELDIPGVTTPSVTDPRDAQIAVLVVENNALRDRVAFLERRIVELECVERSGHERWFETSAQEWSVRRSLATERLDDQGEPLVSLERMLFLLPIRMTWDNA